MVAVVALALNLRPSVNAMGSLIPEVREALGLSATAAGALTSLPPLCFALIGLLAPSLAARWGTERVLALALVVMTFGQVVRVLGAEFLLFAGSLASLAGLALGNVLLPSMIRFHFPQRIPLLTAVYTSCLVIGAAVSSTISVPVERGLGGDWRLGMGMWAALTAIALVPWFGMMRARPAAAAGTARATRLPMRALLRSRVAWNLGVFFGLQSTQAYVVTAWLAQIVVDNGDDLSLGGTAVGIFAVMGLVAALCVPVLLRHEARLRLAITVLCALYGIGYLGVLFLPGATVWGWSAVLGIGSGTFPVILALIAMRARTPAGVSALSAFAQCVGYLIAASGPLLIGAVHDLTGDWVAPLLVMAASTLVMMVIGRRAADPVLVEDDLERP